MKTTLLGALVAADVALAGYLAYRLGAAELAIYCVVLASALLEAGLFAISEEEDDCG